MGLAPEEQLNENSNSKSISQQPKLPFIAGLPFEAAAALGIHCTGWVL